LRRFPVRSASRLATLLLLPIAACAPQARAPVAMLPSVQRVPATVIPPAAVRVPVALLLPLSGNNRPLGEAMLNAAQMALFAQRDAGVEFLPRDTGGTPAGAAEAARVAIVDGARVIAGPLTLTETAAVAAPARAAQVPVLAFTSDAGQAGPGIWVLGITPGDQVDRVVGAALADGARRFGLLAPDDALGQRLAQALRARLAALAAPPPVIVLHPPRGDAALAAGLPRPPRLLGTALWMNDATLAAEPVLVGGWFPGSDPFARAQFDASYQGSFGERPPSLAGVAYDAAALAARIARDPARLPPLGEAFLGADGPLRLLPDGGVRRGLALFAVDPSGTPQNLEPAPMPGLAGS